MMFKPAARLNKHIDMCEDSPEGRKAYADELASKLAKNKTLVKDYLVSGNETAVTEYIRTTHNELMFDVIDSVQRAYDAENGNIPEGYGAAFVGLKDINFNNFDYRILLASQRNDDRVASVGDVWAEAKERRQRSFNAFSHDSVERMRESTLMVDDTQCYMPMTMEAAEAVTDVINDQCATCKKQLKANTLYRDLIDQRVADLHYNLQMQWAKSGLSGVRIDGNEKLKEARDGAKADTTRDNDLSL